MLYGSGCGEYAEEGEIGEAEGEAVGIRRHQSGLQQQGKDEQSCSVDLSHGDEAPEDAKSAHQHRPHEGGTKAYEEEVRHHTEEREHQPHASAEERDAQPRTE